MRHVNEYVDVTFEKIRSPHAVFRCRSQDQQRLEYEVLVGVDEVSLDDVVEMSALVPQYFIRHRVVDVTTKSEDKDDLYDRYVNLSLTWPSAATVRRASPRATDR